MTLQNMKKDIVYAVVTHADKIGFTSNEIDRAKAHRDRVCSTWRVVRITTTYKECN